MTQPSDHNQNTLSEVRAARGQAELLRDQLQAIYQHLRDEENDLPDDQRDNPRRRQGCEMIRKAIDFANHALASIDQGLRENERADKEDY